MEWTNWLTSRPHPFPLPWGEGNLGRRSSGPRRATSSTRAAGAGALERLLFAAKDLGLGAVLRDPRLQLGLAAPEVVQVRLVVGELAGDVDQLSALALEPGGDLGLERADPAQLFGDDGGGDLV